MDRARALWRAGVVQGVARAAMTRGVARGGVGGTTTTTTTTTGARARASAAGETGGPPPPAGVGTIRTLPHARAQTFPMRESAATAKTATAKAAKTAKATVKTVKTAKATVKTVKAKAKTVKTPAKTAKAKTVKTPAKTAPAKTPAKTKAAPEAATAPEAPIGVNRTLPHASAQKFPLHESVTSSASATTPGAAETAVLLSPLSRPAGAATEASASSAASGSGFGDRAGPSRSSLLAAVGVVLVALAAFSANSLDEEDMPPPPRRGKPASAGARKEVDVQIEIVKQPELKELQEEAKKVPERESAGESSRVPEQKGVEASEFADAFGATAEFLANVEVRESSIASLIIFEVFPASTHLSRISVPRADLSRANIKC